MAFQNLSSQLGLIKDCRSIFFLPLSTIHRSNILYKQGSSVSSDIIWKSHLRCLHLTPGCHKGHSKWQNIQHTKAAQDKIKGFKSSELVKRLNVLLRKNPNPDPKLNTDLANLMKWARSNNIPNETINKQIDRTLKARDPKNITTFDGRGLSNTGIIIECFALKPARTKDLLQGMVKKYGFNLHTSGADLFSHKGIVAVEIPEPELSKAQSDPDNFPIDKYIDVAIEAGAEDVTLQGNAEQPFLEFICGPFEYNKVHTNVENAGMVVISSEACFIPTMEVPVSEEFLKKLDDFKAKLDEHPDVLKYFFNVIPEES